MTASEWLSAADALPFANLDTLTGGRGLVVVAPHPDDESLGCGGLIAEACQRGVPVKLVVVSDGVGSHPASRRYPPDRLRDLREAETRAAGDRLGLGSDDIVFLRLPDRFVPASGPAAETAAARIAGIAASVEAGLIAVTWRHDPHCDHQASAAIVDIARRAYRDARVCAYPVWAWALPSDFEVGPAPAGWRIDISARQAVKARAIAAHRSQLTNLIDDDPNGFRLDVPTLARFERPFEILIEVAP